MKNIGEYLRKKRIEKKYSLEDISSELKISQHRLKNIENNEIENSSHYVFHLGHIRSYADFLHLNSNKIVQEFKSQHSIQTSEIINKIPKPTIQNYSFYFNNFSSFLSIIIIFFIFYFLFINTENLNQEYAIIPDIPENFEPLLEKELVDQELKNIETIEKKTKQKNFEENIVSSSAIASSNINENTLSPKIVTLKFINPTWIQLRDADDRIVISQLMTENDEYSYDIKLNYNLTAGNAGNILVLIDNSIIGKVGEFGQVVDSVIIDSNFKN